MSAYAGDDSEETMQKIQQIKVDLESAKDDLQETEYDRYIQDQEKLLDDLYDSYEEVLNKRLDNIDLLLSDMIDSTNASKDTISQTIKDKADSVGYTLSDKIEAIWNTDGKANKVVTTYGKNFDTASTTTNTVLGNISIDVASMISQLNKVAKTNIKSASQSSAATKKPENNSNKNNNKTDQKNNSTPQKTIQVGGLINAGSARIYATSDGEGGGRQYFADDPIYTVLSERNGYILTRWHNSKDGWTGWFKKSDVKAYASGKKNLLGSEAAWTQENGQEFIVRPSDGAILTPLAKGDSVLTAAASSNIWDMANNPADFIKSNLNLDNVGTSANHGNQTNVIQNIDNVVFSMPNVKNYNEMLTTMQNDRNFERLINAMTIDRLNGKSSLAKGKAIR